jgi:predicted metalloprotease
VPDQQWGPPTGPYPQQGTPGGHYPPPSAPGQQAYPGQPQNPYQGGGPGGYHQPAYGSHGYPPQNPGFGWGPGFAGPSGPPPRPPRKPRRTGLIVTLAILGAAIVGVVTIGGLAARGSDIGVSTPTPVASSPPIPSPEPTYDQPTNPTANPTSQPTQPTVQPTRSKVTPPPPKPRPRRPPPPTDREIVQKDRLYRTGSMASVGCHLADVRISDKANITRYYNTVFRCLNSAWSQKMRRAGDPFTVPRLLLVSGPVSGPCGSGFASVSYYCGQNEVIYMRYDLDVRNYNTYPAAYSKVWAKMWALHTLAHEYGHHVQQMTGIMTASWNRTYAMDDESDRLQESRRRELQASCLGNLFAGANRRALPITGENLRQWTWSISHTIDPRRDHGSTNNHYFWAKRGFNGRNPASCNTFTSASSLVS